MDEDEDSDEEVPCRLRKEENEVLQDFKEETGDECDKQDNDLIF